MDRRWFVLVACICAAAVYAAGRGTVGSLAPAADSRIRALQAGFEAKLEELQTLQRNDHLELTRLQAILLRNGLAPRTTAPLPTAAPVAGPAPAPGIVATMRVLTSAEYLRDYAIAKSLANNITTSGNGGEPTVAEQAEKPLCTHINQVFPGRPVNVSADSGYLKRYAEDDLQWRPNASCRAYAFTKAGVQACLEKKQIVLIGDSLLRETQIGLSHVMGRSTSSRGDAHGWFFGSKMRFFFVNNAAQPTPKTGNHAGLPAAVKAADVVVLHHALHDMGSFCHGGIAKHFEGMKKRIADVRQMNPKARVVVLGLRWLHSTRVLTRLPGERKIKAHGYMFNTVLRSMTFRASLRAAAACAGAEYLPIEDLHRRLPLTSHDGLHHEGGRPGALFSDRILSSICPRGGAPPLELAKGADIGSCSMLAAKVKVLAAQHEAGDACIDRRSYNNFAWAIDANGVVPQHVLARERAQRLSKPLWP